MDDIPLFSAEVKIISDPDDGLRFESSEKFSGLISAFLKAKGFSCTGPSVLDAGTNNIHNFVAVVVTGNDFNALEAAVKDFFSGNRVRFKEERQSLVGEITVTLHLLDVSVYDK